MRETMFGAVFTVKNIKGGIRYIDYLPKAQARQLYRFAQEKEEEMAEYRRVRELEDSRARAGGGITVNTNKEKEAQGAEENEPLYTLKKLKGLLEADLISQEEYDNKKKEILEKL